MARMSPEEEIVSDFLESEGIDIEAFNAEKNKLMKRKQRAHLRSELPQIMETALLQAQIEGVREQ